MEGEGALIGVLEYFVFGWRERAALWITVVEMCMEMVDCGNSSWGFSHISVQYDYYVVRSKSIISS